MLISEVVADRVVEEGQITNRDVVLEIGSGVGMITKRLAQKAKRVVSYEIDSQLFEEASNLLSSSKNVEMKLGDAFSPSNEDRFDVCVTSLPYSESLRFVKWLSLRSGSFKRCVAIIQSEFAKKISSKTGMDSYRAVSVIAQNSFVIERLFTINRDEFEPPPKVLSEAVRLTPSTIFDQPFFDSARISLVNQLFSFRGKLLSTAIKKMLEPKLKQRFPEELLKTRIEDLTPSEVGELIIEIEKIKN
jgi:16S rRNA (adenine1518-N6/adenine1519-N6)-dimethyltransferase